eukprot:GHVU01089668.1.p1 GENE.GHVU01089668.1~~GHVU01089668.1.p1  ORF type:complete len:161 (-),score=19.57 GHVU01089668.1:304-786(-)
MASQEGGTNPPVYWQMLKLSAFMAKAPGLEYRDLSRLQWITDGRAQLMIKSFTDLDPADIIASVRLTQRLKETTMVVLYDARGAKTEFFSVSDKPFNFMAINVENTSKGSEYHKRILHKIRMEDVQLIMRNSEGSYKTLELINFGSPPPILSVIIADKKP